MDQTYRPFFTKNRVTTYATKITFCTKLLDMFCLNFKFPIRRQVVSRWSTEHCVKNLPRATKDVRYHVRLNNFCQNDMREVKFTVNVALAAIKIRPTLRVGAAACVRN